MNKDTTTTETITTFSGSTITLEYSDHFAGRQFIQDLIKQFGEPGENANHYIFSLRALEMLISYGVEHHNASKNQLAYFLFDTVPDVTFREIVAYCENDILTNNAQLEKYDYWEAKGAKE